MTRPSCFGRHDWTPPDARGRRKCRRCGDVTPRPWDWWAEPIAPKPVPDGQLDMFGDAA